MSPMECLSLSPRDVGYLTGINVRHMHSLLFLSSINSIVISIKGKENNIVIAVNRMAKTIHLQNQFMIHLTI